MILLRRRNRTRGSSIEFRVIHVGFSELGCKMLLFNRTSRSFKNFCLRDLRNSSSAPLKKKSNSRPKRYSFTKTLMYDDKVLALSFKASVLTSRADAFISFGCCWKDGCDCSSSRAMFSDSMRKSSIDEIDSLTKSWDAITSEESGWESWRVCARSCVLAREAAVVVEDVDFSGTVLSCLSRARIRSFCSLLPLPGVLCPGCASASWAFRNESLFCSSVSVSSAAAIEDRRSCTC